MRGKARGRDCQHSGGMTQSCTRASPVLLAFLFPFSELLGLGLPIFLVLQRKGENHLLGWTLLLPVLDARGAGEERDTLGATHPGKEQQLGVTASEWRTIPEPHCPAFHSPPTRPQNLTPATPAQARPTVTGGARRFQWRYVAGQ